MKDTFNIDFTNPCNKGLIKKLHKQPRHTPPEFLDKEIVGEIIYRAQGRERMILELMGRIAMWSLPMKEWKKSSCVLCAQNCGLEVLIDNGRMTEVRPDGENPRSEGYVCRKGMNVMYYQHQKDRLTQPLKRIGDQFVPISWEMVIEEISEKLLQIRTDCGPRSLAYMGASMQGGHFEAGFVVSLMRGGSDLSTFTLPPDRSLVAHGGSTDVCWVVNIS